MKLLAINVWWPFVFILHQIQSKDFGECRPGFRVGTDFSFCDNYYLRLIYKTNFSSAETMPYQRWKFAFLIKRLLQIMEHCFRFSSEISFGNQIPSLKDFLIHFKCPWTIEQNEISFCVRSRVLWRWSNSKACISELNVFQDNAYRIYQNCNFKTF